MRIIREGNHMSGALFGIFFVGFVIMMYARGASLRMHGDLPLYAIIAFMVMFFSYLIGFTYESWFPKYVLCPHCKEGIKPDVTVCPHCGRDVNSKLN